MRIPVGIEKVLYLAAVDAGFREALLSDRAGALARPGVDLLEDEAAILKCIPDEQLQVMISQIDPAAHGRKRFMQKVASCAVALAATTAGAGCEKSRDEVSTASSNLQAGAVTSTGDAGVTFRDETAFLYGTPAGSRGDRPLQTESLERVKGDISLGAVSVEGGVDVARIEGVVRARLLSLKDCYERELGRSQGLRGNITFGLVVGNEGEVVEVKVTQNELCGTGVADCIVARIKHWRFPRSWLFGTLVTIPMMFSKEE